MFPHLFQPLEINGTIFKNRIIATPTGDSFEDKAVGGAGLIVAGHAIVEPGRSSFASADEPYPFAKYERESTRHRVLQIHQSGAKASIEIFHGGQESRVVDYAVGPCAFTRDDGVEVRALDEPMMAEVAADFAQACVDARRIGFDAVLLHFGHGWLPDQFLSPFYNHRADAYGGSIENRAKFPLQILKAVRRAVGPRFPVEMRISAYEWVEGSIEFPDVLAFAKMAEPYVDIIQVSSGIDKNLEANVHCITTNLEPEMTNLAWAREVKKAVQVPVSVVGAFMTPQEAEDAIARGDVDLVAFGRTLIADPAWPRKALDGRVEDIVPCLRCSNCYHIASDHWNVGCSVNPRYHNESFVPARAARAEHPRHVVVVGAGPAGIRAAITSFDRGHQVTLIEREHEVGGMLRVIAREHHKEGIPRLLAYYRTQLERRPIDIMLDTVATPDLLRDLKADTAIIAIGARERRPPIEGVDAPQVLLGTQAIERASDIAGRVAIIGGGSIGCELALEFAENGCEVLVIEMTAGLASNANALYREALRQKFALHPQIEVALQASCTRIGSDGVEYVRDGVNRSWSCEHVVVSTGTTPKTDEALTLYGAARETVSIGDCVSPRSIMEATFEGHTFALTL